MEIELSDALERFVACRYTRNAAVQSCFHTLQKVLHIKGKVSELRFKNIWFKKLSRIKNIVSNGWYDPPPDGIGVLFGGENDFVRVNYSTLREKDYWPKADIYFSKEGLGYIFTSPFTFVNAVPIIGDFGFTFYLGNHRKIINHFKKCYLTMHQLTDIIEVGMEYRQLYKEALKLITENSLMNNITSTTDVAGTNLGHSIPFMDRNPADEENKLLMVEDEEMIHKVINKARIFINKSEDFKIGANSAFTFEPRLISAKDSSLPMCSFHMIVQFIKKKKIVLENFTSIFNLLGMNWLTR